MAKLKKYLAIRLRIIGDFEHHNEEMDKFTTESKATAISFRVVALEKTYKEFSDINDELEKIASYQDYENKEELMRKNRTIQDKLMKLKVSELLPDADANLNETFFPIRRTR